MCVNSLNGKVMYKKAAENLVVSNLCVNTRTHTQSHLYIKITIGSLLLVINLGRNLCCGSMLNCVQTKSIKSIH